MNNKGLSTIELIVCLALVSIIMVVMLQLLIDIRYEDMLSKNRTNNLLNQALIVKSIQSDTIINTIEYIEINNNTYQICYLNSICYNLIFEDNSITYKDEKYTFKGSARIDIENIIIKEKSFNSKGYLFIIIPIKDKNGFNYNIEIFYVYNGLIPQVRT